MSQMLHAWEQRLANLIGERRRSNRRRVACAVQLPVGVSMENARLVRHTEHYPEPIMGHTRDVSETGLSLVVPRLSLGTERVDEADYPLRIVLCLPSGVIIVHAETARCEEIMGPGQAEQYLLGARITRLSAPDQRRYDAFLRTLG